MNTSPLSLLSRALEPQPHCAVRPVDAPAAVDRLIELLDECYVFPEQALAIGQCLSSRRARYNGIVDPIELAQALTADMRSVADDSHLRVIFSEAELPPESAADDDAMSPEDVVALHRMNFGFEKLEHLPQNIGYLDLRLLMPGSSSRLAAAMTLFADTDALIIDLREARGGEPQAVAELASYFLNRRTHLSDVIDRHGQVAQSIYSRDDLPGPRYGERRPLVLLTSRTTFSGAEDFSYTMKNLRRATLVGEPSGGGAHPGCTRPIAPHLAAFIPTTRSRSPITLSDWEGAGVQPDIEVPAAQALMEAQRRLRDRLRSMAC